MNCLLVCLLQQQASRLEAATTAALGRSARRQADSGTAQGARAAQGAKAAGDSARRQQVKGESAGPQAAGDNARPKAPGEEGQRKQGACWGGDRARCQAARDGARHRVVRGERWRTAPGGEKCGSGQCKALVAER
eukprot:6211869-Pleurochrysis_carterae.AAC.1